MGRLPWAGSLYIVCAQTYSDGEPAYQQDGYTTMEAWCSEREAENKARELNRAFYRGLRPSWYADCLEDAVAYNPVIEDPVTLAESVISRYIPGIGDLSWVEIQFPHDLSDEACDAIMDVLSIKPYFTITMTASDYVDHSGTSV